MKRVIAALFALALAAAATPHAQAQAPFCAVTALGFQCQYHSYSACQQAVRGMDGVCVANPQPTPSVQAPIYPPTSAPAPPQAQNYDVSGAMQRGYAEGQRLRIERERHEAEMRVLQAQAASPRVVTNDGYWVMYRCPDGAGGHLYSAVPAPGCVVDYVTAY